MKGTSRSFVIQQASSAVPAAAASPTLCASVSKFVVTFAGKLWSASTFLYRAVAHSQSTLHVVCRFSYAVLKCAYAACFCVCKFVAVTTVLLDQYVQPDTILDPNAHASQHGAGGALEVARLARL